MNCANHPDITSVAYCRTCGKALCANCTRTVRGVIYCENCLAERLEGVQPPATAYQPFVQPSGAVPPQPGGGPNPTVAGILAGFFPFGVGAVYCGQYAKALAHLLQLNAGEPLRNALQRRGGDNRRSVSYGVVRKAFGCVTHDDLLLEINAEPLGGVLPRSGEGKCA